MAKAQCDLILSLSVRSKISLPLTVAVNAQVNNSPYMTTTYFQTFEPSETFFEPITHINVGCTTYTYTFDYTLHVGDQMATHDDSYTYMIPFERGSKVKVIQGYDGSFSHNGPQRFALDFEVPVGTPIYAARSGVIVGIRSDSKLGGPSAKYAGKENYIWILHDDNTVAWYAHLNADGVKVTSGQKVQAGDLIGYSGKTGFAEVPHLHFHVSTVIGPNDPPNDSNPKHLVAFKTFITKFQTMNGVEQLIEGQTYTVP